MGTVARDQRLDTLRGLLIVLMTYEHVSHLKAFTVGLLGYTTVAEGFVFLSGYVTGRHYGSVARARSFAEMRKRTARRALAVYATHAGVYALILALFVLTGGWGGSWNGMLPLFRFSPALSGLLGAVLLYQPTFLDILPMYVVFLLLSPFAVRACLGGRGAAVLLCSVSVYILSRLGLRDFLLAPVLLRVPADPGFFDIFAWQLLFCAGLSAGTPPPGGDSPARTHHPALLAGCAAAALLLAACRNGILDSPWGSGLFSGGPLERSALAPLRLFNFAVLAYPASWLLSRSGAAASVPPLAFLGRHSLQVFAFQTVLVFLLYPVSRIYALLPVPFRAGLVALSLAALYLPAWGHRIYSERREKARTRPRSR